MPRPREITSFLSGEQVRHLFVVLVVIRHQRAPHKRLITLVSDRSGHARRYSIDPTLIQNELGWRPRHTFEEGLDSTLRWFLNNLEWCQAVQHDNR